MEQSKTIAISIESIAIVATALTCLIIVIECVIVVYTLLSSVGMDLIRITTTAIGICLMIPWVFGVSVYWAIEEYHIPASWFLIATFLGLLESILFVFTPLNLLGSWFLPPWILTLISPFILYVLKLGDLERPLHQHLMDKDILDVARKYGGIITLSVIVWELKVSLESAQKSLERFVKHGEAIRKKVDSLLIYDFQSARIHLARSDNLIVEALRDNPFGLSRSELISQTGVAIEVLDESIKRLEDLKIIYQDMVTDKYKLRSYSLPTAT